MKIKFREFLFSALFSVALGVSLGYIGALGAGCKTSAPSTPEDRAQRLANAARFAAHVGTVEHLKRKPQDRPYFVAAHAALGLLTKNTNAAPADLAIALSGLPVDELQGPYGVLIVYAGFVAIQEGGDEVDINSNVYLRRITEAIYSGMGSGLKQSKP